jgi:hypothetical protein
VVIRALNLSSTTEKAPDAPINIHFPFLSLDSPVQAKVETNCWKPMGPMEIAPSQPYQDIAILKLLDIPPQDARPLPIANISDIYKHPFAAYGYPADKPSGAWVNGVLVSADETGLIQIEDSKQTGYFIQPGFSGSRSGMKRWDRLSPWSHWERGSQKKESLLPSR